MCNGFSDCKLKGMDEPDGGPLAPGTEMTGVSDSSPVQLNCTRTAMDWPEARPLAAGTVMYGVPDRSPVLLTRVIVFGTPKSTSWSGPLIVLVPILMSVMIPLNVSVTGL